MRRDVANEPAPLAHLLGELDLFQNFNEFEVQTLGKLKYLVE